MAKFLNAILRLQLIVTALVCMAAAQSKPGCRSTCGDLQIPYPFGTDERCSRNKTFLITCYQTSSGDIRANLSRGNIPVLNISLEGEILINSNVSSDCSNGQYTSWWHELSEFSISNVKNKFIVVGCDTYGTLVEWGHSYSVACSSTCRNIRDLVNGSCTGLGCCQASLPKVTKAFNISLSSFNNYKDVRNFNPCGYSFVVENGFYSFSIQDLKGLRKKTEFPVVLNWAIENKTCSEAMKDTSSYACKENSYCYEPKSDLGYLCKCKEGFRGNPYLHGGCQVDVGCKGNGYNCTKKEYNKLLITEIALGVTAGLLVLVVLMSSLCWVHKQRTIEQLRRKHFKQNGGLMLEERLSERIKTFKEIELEKATNNFHENKIVGRGGHGVVYKGILPDNTPVAIKKSTTGVGLREVNDFINEMVVLSQINHRNVVNLLGFCLETQVPLLVYEFVSNGTLLHHIDPRNERTISWETRLRIVADTAEAISYLHSSASIPIIHRDIKSTNILLDHNNKAKVSDFGASRLVPLDEDPFAMLVQGTPGYLDPEYLRTTQLNEKSDVYSFGVVLMELLTGKKAVEFNREKQRKYLAMEFVYLMEERRLLEILDKRVMNKSNADQLKKVALLAERCVKMKGNERPSMKEVAAELDGLIMVMEKHTRVKGDEHLLGEASGSSGDAGIGNSAGDDSIQNQMPLEIGNGR